VSPHWTAALLALGRRLIGDRKVDLPFKDVHAGHVDLQLVADRKAPARLPPDQTPLGRLEGVEIIGQRLDMDESGNQNVRQFDE